MTHHRRRRTNLARILVMAPLALAGGLAVSPAQAGADRILTVTKSALYGGAAGLLMGGVLTLVVKSQYRDDVVRWGIVAGTFAGFAYGMYDTRGGSDSFTELVRARADARRRSRQTMPSEVGIPPEPAMGSATGRNSW